jgi:hypothetical protein
MTNEKECFGQRSEGAKEEGVQEERSSGDEPGVLILNSCNS